MASTIVVDKIQKTGGVPFTLPVADATVSGQSLQSDSSRARHQEPAESYRCRAEHSAALRPCSDTHR